MKPFAGGQLLNAGISPFGQALTPYQCLQYALDRPAVLTVLPGVRGMDDLKDALGFLSASEEERDYAVISQFTPAGAQGRCVYCNHCMPCPTSLNIGLINKYYDLACTGRQTGRAALCPTFTSTPATACTAATASAAAPSTSSRWSAWTRSLRTLDLSVKTENGRRGTCSPSAIALTEPTNAKNCPDKEEIGGDFCFLRQLHLHPAVTYVHVSFLGCKFASLACGFSHHSASLPLCQHPAPEGFPSGLVFLLRVGRHQRRPYPELLRFMGGRVCVITCQSSSKTGIQCFQNNGWLLPRSGRAAGEGMGRPAVKMPVDFLQRAAQFADLLAQMFWRMQ